MARGIAFSQMVLDLRAELRRSQSPAVGVEDLPTLKRALNRNYHFLWMHRDWEFLKRKFTAITMNAGQRYYDFPDGFDETRVLEAKVKHSSTFIDLDRGITLDDYNIHDPEDNERSAPVLKWDVVDNAGSTQLEFWPLPDSTAQSVRFVGYVAVNTLVDDDDVCLLDDYLVVTISAAEILGSIDAGDMEAKRDLANELIRLHGIRGAASGRKVTQMGLGSEDVNKRPGKAIVRVS